MYARVITARAGTEGFESAVSLAERQLAGARQRPGFAGFYVLTDTDSGKLLIISLWATRAHMEEVAAGQPSGIHAEGIEATGLTSLNLDTYEVALQG